MRQFIKSGSILRMVAAVSLATTSSLSQANLLSCSGFECNSLTTIGNTLGSINAYQGQWGQENATIVGATSGVTPSEGSKMLSELNDGLIATQTLQAVPLTGADLAAGIAGTLQYNLSALFTTGTGVSGAQGSVALYFLSAPTWGSNSGPYASSGLYLDGIASTWESISLSGTAPAGTTWLVAQVAYTNSTLGNNAGFVDDARLTVAAVPLPATVWLFGSALAGLIGQRGKRAVRAVA